MYLDAANYIVNLSLKLNSHHFVAKNRFYFWNTIKNRFFFKIDFFSFVPFENMKQISVIFFLVWIAPCLSQSNYGKPEVDPIAIQKNFSDWSVYQNNRIMLTLDFKAIDIHSNYIDKNSFLNQLTLGECFPIRLVSKTDDVYYQLFKIEPQSDSSIRATMVANAIEEYEHFKMEGQSFAAFHFTDLEGNVYTNESVKGKILVIKCWYIHCSPCIKEFPDLNRMTAKYKDRKDIVFVSLAEDTPEQLTAFLAKKPLSYAVVPNQKKYMNESLHLNAFPTHFIIDKNGMIVKVLRNFESMELALEKISKSE